MLSGTRVGPSGSYLPPSTDRAAAIGVWGLWKGYGYQPVLRGLELRVGWGECLALLGANGAGKTTLLKVLSTQARPDRGRLEVGGIDARADPTGIRRAVGVVSHRHMLYEDMTAVENLKFYGRMYGLSSLDTRISDVLTRVGMGQWAHHRVRVLSNGQQKRVAIARAVLHRPRVLLLDEPESGLDASGLDMLGELVQEWRGEGGCVIMATHNLDKGMEWADRVAILSEGRIALDEPSAGLDLAVFNGAYRRMVEMVL